MRKESVQPNDVFDLISLGGLEEIRSNSKVLKPKGIVELGVLHGLGAWCYTKLKSSKQALNEESIIPWKQHYIQTTLKYQQKLKVFNNIQLLLRKEGIPVIALKGMALASWLYKDEGTRPMGDIDILVPEGKATRALEILLLAGAESNIVSRSLLHEQVHSHVRAINFQGVLIEIHQRLFSLGSTFYNNTKYFFAHKIDIQKQGVNLTILNNLHMGYHLVAHAAVGIEMGGIRLGWLLDIAKLWSREEDMLGFMHKVIDVKKDRAKELKRVFRMASLFLSQEKRIQIGKVTGEEIVHDIYKVMINSRIERKHRWVNLREILRTPGIEKKALLLFRELIPEPAYMRFKYNENQSDSLMRLYLKRLFRI